MLIGFEASALQGQKSGVGYYTENMIENVVAASPGDRFVLFSSRNLGREEAEQSRSQGSSGERFSTGNRLGKAANTHYNRRHFPVRAVWMQTVLPVAIRDVRPDVCHFTNYLAPLNCPCPYVVTIYDMSVFITPRYHTLKKMVLDRTLIPTVARRAAAIITLSESARNDIVRYLGVSREKITVVTGAASSQFQPVTDRARLDEVRYFYGLDAPYILYVGTIEPRKNISRLVQAFSRLKARGLPHKLVLVGQPGWQMPPLYEEIEKHQLGRDLVFTGYVPPEHLAPLYTMAESMAFPSLYEGFGLPIVEAMACGTPVVTSKSSSLAEVAGDAALLVDPLSVGDIEGALWRLHADPDLRNSLSILGRRRASAFTWEKSARITLDVYARAAQQRTTARDHMQVPVLLPETQVVPTSKARRPDASRASLQSGALDSSHSTQSSQ